MNYQPEGAGRAITDYFNSSSFHSVKESELLEAIMVEVMHCGPPASNKAIIANVIARLNGELDKSVLLGCRKLLTEVLNIQD